MIYIVSGIIVFLVLRINDMFGYIRAAAWREGIKQGVLESFAAHESGFDPNAIGDGGRSRGLFQIWEPTARALGIDDLETLFDPDTAARAAATLLKQMHVENGWDGTDLIAAYNAGRPRKNEAGQYTNSRGLLNVQAYVDKVTAQMLSRGVDPARESLFIS